MFGDNNDLGIEAYVAMEDGTLQPILDISGNIQGISWKRRWRVYQMCTEWYTVNIKRNEKIFTLKVEKHLLHRKKPFINTQLYIPF